MRIEHDNAGRAPGTEHRESLWASHLGPFGGGLKTSETSRPSRLPANRLQTQGCPFWGGSEVQTFGHRRPCERPDAGPKRVLFSFGKHMSQVQIHVLLWLVKKIDLYYLTLS